MKTKLLVSSFFVLFIAASVNAQWFKQTTTIPATIPLNSIHCIDANNCFVAGATTTVRKTTDGINWNVTGTVGIQDKTFIKMWSKDTVVLGQVNGNFRTTLTGGTNWSGGFNGDPGVSSANVYFNDVALIAKNNFVSVGGNIVNQVNAANVTATSINTGTSWTNFTGSGFPTFFGVHALSTTTLVACGGAASVYKSIDAGATWAPKFSGTPSTTTLYDIHFPTSDSDTGYAVGGNSSNPALGGVVYKTTTYGEAWVQVGVGTLLPNALYGVHFVSKDIGYVVGDGGKIQVTMDGGATWTSQISPVTTTLNKIHFPTSKIGYICGVNAVILKTTNGGFVNPLVANAGPDASICIGGCVTLGASPAATGGTIPYTYSWNTGATTSSLVVCSSVTATYTLTVLDANNISSKDSAKVTAYVNPSVSFSGLDTTYCNKVTADVLTGTPGGGTFTGPGVTAGVFNATGAGPGTHTVTYTYTSPEGCVITSKKNTTVLPGPTPVQLCLVTVDSTMTNLQNHVIWTKPVSADIDSFRIYRSSPSAPTFALIATVSYSAAALYVDQGAAVTPKTQPYSYKISSIDSCGGESTLSDTNSTMHAKVTGYSLPSKVDLSWTDYNGFGLASYEIWTTTDNGANWGYIDGVAYGTSNTYSHGGSANPAPLTSRYRIRATYPQGCNTGVSTYTYSLSNVTDDYSAINEVALNNWLNVYPNPNHGTFNIELSGIGFEILGTKVYNMLGDVIYQSSEKLAEISIPGITSGVYHLEVITDKGTANKKVAIE
ncbi:MAG: T9SS type A sorting domain-containing protein [Bacteroidetes bacterium]|nr:MAG: T9SS type A sorting domain-containing protein [Bacteroidota bacterium]